MRHSTRFIDVTAKLLIVLLLLATTFLTGCADDDCDECDSNEEISMTILHVNDVHSHLAVDSIDLTLDDVTTEAELGGMAKVAAEISALKAEHDNTLVLHAGDAVQGTLYYTLFKGEADAEVMNAIGFDAMAIGNHEFDDGDEWLADFIDLLDFPLLSANIEVPADNVLSGKYEPYKIQTVGGKKVGIIGLTIAGKTEESSQPSADVTFNDEVTSVQETVATLVAAGVNKIVLLSHYGYQNSIALASQIPELDVIIDGDSHTLLGDFSSYGLTSSGDYPTVAQNADGEMVCIAQAWEYSKVLGELNVTFAGDAVKSCQGTPHLLLGETFIRTDDEDAEYTVSGDGLTTLEATLAADPQLTVVADDTAVAAIIETYAAQVDALGETEIGTAAEALNHIRVPGQDDTLPLGSDIAPVVAKAFYDQDPNADISIQNAGGVRISVPAGSITYDTAYTLLPFANTLFEIEMYGSEIKQVLEDAIENIAQGGSTGSFPYCYALRYDVDATQEYGSRVSNLEFKDRTTGTYSDLDDTTLYVVVTNNYIAAGRDGYDTFATVQTERGEGIDTYLDYAMSFVNYVLDLTEADEEVEALPAADHPIKSYIATEDTDDSL